MDHSSKKMHKRKPKIKKFEIQSGFKAQAMTTDEEQETKEMSTNTHISLYLRRPELRME